MSIESLAQAAEVVAAFATVGTLLFVAFEMRARRKQDRLTMLTTLDRCWNEITSQTATNEKSALVFWNGTRHPEELTEAEFAQFRSIAVQYINIHRTMFALLREDSLDSHHSRWFEYDAVHMYKSPGIWKIFLEIEEIADPAFVEYIRSKVGVNA